MSIILAVTAIFSLAGSEWGPAGGGDQFIHFEAARINGHSGCNRYSAAYGQDRDHLKIGPIIATKMACAGGRMEQERAWFAMLERVRAFEASHLILTLKDGEGQIIARLQRRDFD